MKKAKLLHRLSEARALAGVSLRGLSKRTGIPVSTLRQQEASNDIGLVDLVKWSTALGVPMNELTLDPPDQLDEKVAMRAGLIQLMKSVKSLLQNKLTDGQRAVVENMQHRLHGLMPELDSIGAWPQVGSQRRQKDPARVETQVIATAIWCGEFNEV